MSLDTEKLLSDPSKPNWVSTRATDEKHKIDAWPMQGDLLSTKGKIKKAAEKLGGAKLVIDSGQRISYEFTTRLLRFTDDVVFQIDESTKQVHFISASRVGYGDLGANRSRMEKLKSFYFQN
jgi:uncharacterized protein (DUF1499 family)